MRRNLTIIAIGVFLVSCAQEAGPLSSSTSQFETNGFQQQVPDTTLFTNHLNDPRHALSLEPATSSQNRSAVQIGSGGSSSFTGFGPGNCNPPDATQQDPIAQFISLTNYVFCNYPTVQTVGWVYFADQPFYTSQPLSGHVSSAGPLSNTNACMNYQITITDSTAGDSLARIRLYWNQRGVRPTYTRSGPNNNTLTVTYQLIGGGTGDFMFAVTNDGTTAAASPTVAGNNFYNYFSTLGAHISMTVAATECNVPGTISPDTNQYAKYDLGSYMSTTGTGPTMPYFNQQLGVSSVQARFISRPANFQNAGFFNPNQYTPFVH